MSPERMRWTSLLSHHRLGGPPVAGVGPRSEFQRDFDRIVFSSAFRRLQDKTQVFPLAKNDYVRTRLTHSLEVASVGRSLGVLAGDHVLRAQPEMAASGYTAADFGAIVAAACLAHDIGNPPFGHAGEAAIQSWFETPELGRSILARLAAEGRADFERFEGNAQTFRILARLGMPDNAGGMQLTCASLAAVAKYPRAAHLAFAAPAGISGKKHNFFRADRERFEAVAQATGLLRREAGAHCWCRHPLAFLVEAADDISYCVIDVEDAFRAGEMRYAEIEPLYRGILGDPAAWTKAGAISTDEKRVEYLRARTIDTLVNEAAAAFAAREQAMLAGEFDEELIAVIPHAAALEAFRALARDRVYHSAVVLNLQSPGAAILGELLDAFVGAVEAAASGAAAPRAREILDLLPGQFLSADGAPATDLYARVLAITDFVSGMTDTYAVAVAAKVRALRESGGR
ncbi:MAG: dNTP triphosphohydrolase [Burkholderiales bacterium]|nr:dNTP triphosphohydrolase [Burkholderiales bacterium]